MKHRLILVLVILGMYTSIFAKGGNGYNLLPQYVDTVKTGGSFAMVANGKASTIYVDASDWKGVCRAANDLANDIKAVTGVKTKVVESTTSINASVIIGTIGKSKLIDNLIAQKKLNVDGIRGQWESFVIETIDGNLVVAGSDKRGTIYGIYDISEKIGVSPWYYWADVPVKKSGNLYVKNGRYVLPSPKVKYRGIFINDEWPSFGGWAKDKFGGTNSKMYATMFELLLRLKANYLWPAMWANAFNEDDPLNPQVADEYGIVMGTSHHEPMMRAHKEYTKRKKEVGAWDYASNKENLDKFFRDGLERNKNYDNLITIGMRGDGDRAMGKGNDEENMRVLQNVVKGQRQIIEDVYGKKASEIPQLWAIFTEVQRYYDAGFNVPEDVTLLFCDNNWGQIRRIGPKKERKRKGGMGLYYHIDMNGGPASDRWINTTTAPKLREQLNLAYQTGIDRIWVINVGDLKPKEMPIDFIMRFAWNPDAISANDVDNYMTEWARRIFGDEYAEDIADVVSKYSQYNLMRKAEVQNPNIFSIVNHNESDRMLQMWKEVADKAERLWHKISPEAKDAYYQLVLYPTVASAGVAEVYLATGKNNLYAKQGRVSANDYADRAGVLFERDIVLTDYYNHSMTAGKWNGMMRDKHIGFVSWQTPKVQTLPPLEVVSPLKQPTMGIAIEGNESAWPGTVQEAVLPLFEPLDSKAYFIDIFNKGTGCFEFIASVSQPWIKISQERGMVEKDVRVFVSVDWDKLTEGNHQGNVIIRQGNNSQTVVVKAKKYALPVAKDSFFGCTSEFSIPAYAFNNNVAGKNAKWNFAPGMGRGKGCMNIEPVTAPSATPANAPRLEYNVYLPEEGDLTVCLGILPVQDVDPARGMRIAVSIDNETPIILDARKGMHDEFREYTEKNLALSPHIKALPKIEKELALRAKGKPRRSDVFDNMRWIDVDMDKVNAGMHTLKVYMIDPEVVLEQIVINPDNSRPSYWGKPAKHHSANL